MIARAQWFQLPPCLSSRLGLLIFGGYEEATSSLILEEESLQVLLRCSYNPESASTQCWVIAELWKYLSGLQLLLLFSAWLAWHPLLSQWVSLKAWVSAFCSTHMLDFQACCFWPPWASGVEQKETVLDTCLFVWNAVFPVWSSEKMPYFETRPELG